MTLPREGRAPGRKCWSMAYAVRMSATLTRWSLSSSSEREPRAARSARVVPARFNPRSFAELVEAVNAAQREWPRRFRSVARLHRADMAASLLVPGRRDRRRRVSAAHMRGCSGPSADLSRCSGRAADVPVADAGHLCTHPEAVVVLSDEPIAQPINHQREILQRPADGSRWRLAHALRERHVEPEAVRAPARARAARSARVVPARFQSAHPSPRSSRSSAKTEFVPDGVGLLGYGGLARHGRRDRRRRVSRRAQRGVRDLRQDLSFSCRAADELSREFLELLQACRGGVLGVPRRDPRASARRPSGGGRGGLRMSAGAARGHLLSLPSGRRRRSGWAPGSRAKDVALQNASDASRLDRTCRHRGPVPDRTRRRRRSRGTSPADRGNVIEVLGIVASRASPVWVLAASRMSRHGPPSGSGRRRSKRRVRSTGTPSSARSIRCWTGWSGVPGWPLDQHAAARRRGTSQEWQAICEESAAAGQPAVARHDRPAVGRADVGVRQATAFGLRDSPCWPCRPFAPASSAPGRYSRRRCSFATGDIRAGLLRRPAPAVRAARRSVLAEAAAPAETAVRAGTRRAALPAHSRPSCLSCPSRPSCL